VYDERGLIQTAEALIQRVLISYKDTLGHNHPLTIEAVEFLALAQQRMGELSEAEDLFKQALRSKECRLGRTHLETLKSVARLAVIYDLQGRPVEAEHKYTEALEGLKRVLGKDHPEVLKISGNRGLSLRLSGQLNEAEQQYADDLVTMETRPDLYSSDKIKHTAVQLYATRKKNPDCRSETANEVAQKYGFSTFELEELGAEPDI
jgi:tetratricopeptide (TPR) repeat protein